jgi:hypothetical protein
VSIEAFIIGSNKQFYNKQQKSINSNEWDKDWKLLGSEQQFFSFGQQPAIAMNGDSRFDVFWLKDNALFHSYQDKPNSAWSATQSNEIGEADFEGDPVLAQNVDGIVVNGLTAG